MKTILKIVALMFGHCRHRWIESERAEVADSEKLMKGVIYILKCKRCGDITTRRAMV